MAGDTGMAGKVTLLLWAQTLGLADAQTTQLLVQPPWTPAVLWDQVTLTCQGSGTAGVTTWYKDGQRWEQTGSDNFRVNRSGTYTCERPGSGLSSPVTVSDDWLVLQVPARALLEGDMVTLRCRPWRNMLVTEVQFYRGDEKVSPSLTGTELSLSPLQQHHSGYYRCRASLSFGLSPWAQPVPVTVHAVAAGVSGSILFLVLLLAVIVSWRWRHRLALRKQQARLPPDPPAPPEEGEVLYTPIMITEWPGGPPRAKPCQVTYAELPGPHGRQQDSSDIYENVL